MIPNQSTTDRSEASAGHGLTKRLAVSFFGAVVGTGIGLVAGPSIYRVVLLPFQLLDRLFNNRSGAPLVTDADPLFMTMLGAACGAAVGWIALGPRERRDGAVAALQLKCDTCGNHGPSYADLVRAGRSVTNGECFVGWCEGCNKWLCDSHATRSPESQEVHCASCGTQFSLEH